MGTLLQVTLCGAVAVTVCFVLSWRPRAKRDPRQPEAVPAIIPIPFIGHALGLLIYRNHYYTKISQRWNLPIVALSMFGGNVYVISSPDLVYSLQRQPKSLSFWYFEAHFTAKLGGLSQAGTEGCFQGVRPESKDDCTLIDTLKGTKLGLSPQGDLNRMVGVATKILSESLETLKRNGKPLDLYAWMEHHVMMATTDAVYGPGNPYRDPKVEAGFWDFANAAMFVSLPSTLAKLLAPKGLAGRESLAASMNQYYVSGGLQNGSKLAMARHSILNPTMDQVDIARAESVHGLAVIANVVPTAFWTVYHVFSDPMVLKKVREQVEEIATTETTAPDHIKQRIVDMSKLKDASFTFSVIQETLRYRARGTGPRMVLEDATLSDGQREYLIEKDSVIILAHEGMHYNKDVWGETADKFVADRFLPGNKIPANAFRGFGGGANMCPGKGFATTEIAALVAMLAVQFDLKPIGGKWIEPGQDQSNMARENTPPIRKTLVEIAPRPGTEREVWKLTMEA